MNDFEKILWGFTFSAIGIAFGWTLNQLGQWFRTRQEDKKVLKQILFNLLETYFIFMKSDLNKMVEKVSAKVIEKIPPDQRSVEGKKMMDTLYLEVLTNYLKPELLEQLKTVQNNYQSSIETLASIYPLEAFYLSGKPNLLTRFDNIQSCLDNLKNQSPGKEDEIGLVVSQVMTIIKPEIINSTLIDLEKDITDISWKINPYIWFKSIRGIKRIKLNSNEQFDKEVDKWLDKLSL